MSKPEFVYVTYIETTPEKLWQALTSSEFTRLYWWGTSVVSDWKVGSSFKLVMNGTATDDGEVLEADPPRRLSYTFHHLLSERAKQEGRRVTFVLEPHGKLVKLTLTHQGFAPDSVVLDGISRGWPAILSSLKSMLESGTALAIPLSCMESQSEVRS
jgi:uncharacterized protein YndB with AHSA1/START domain